MGHNRKMQEPRIYACPLQFCVSVLTATCALFALCTVVTLPVCRAERALDLEVHSRLPRENSAGVNENSSGGKAVLTYKQAPCLIKSLAVGKISPRANQLWCSVIRSASRAEYLSRGILSNSSKPDSPNDVELKAKDSSVSSDHILTNRSLETEIWYHGEYLMSLEIGTPARVFTGIIDTGSDLTWIQCRPCFDCFSQPDIISRPWESSTYQQIYCESKTCDYVPVSFCSPYSHHCNYRYRYGDSSYTIGSLSSEVFTFNATDDSQLQFPDIVYGCSHGSDGYFTFTGADGIIGLGQGPLSLTSQIGAFLGSKAFAYCLVRQRTTSDPVTSHFYFGKASVPSNSTGLSYTRLLTNHRRPALYYVEFTGISVGNSRLKIAANVFALNSETGRGGTIIDSGTTVTNLEKTAFDALRRAFAASVPYNTTDSFSGFALCFDVRGRKREDLEFPSLTFHLQGVDLDLPFDNYIVEAEDDTVCLAIHRSGDHNLSILGNIQQQTYQIVYDRDNRRIGFMPAACG